MTLPIFRLVKLIRKPRPAGRRPSRSAAPPRGEALEDRTLNSIVGLTASASPSVLRRINPMNEPHAVQVARVRPVTLSGYVLDDATVPSVSFRVVDEYGRDQPSGSIAPQKVMTNQFFYTTRFGLDLTIRPGDRDGRQYTIFVTATDPASTITTAVTLSAPPGRLVPVRSARGA